MSEPVFGHGQLNVAASRVGSREKIKFAIKPPEEGWDNFTSNVVFREVLLNANQNTEDCYDPTTPFDDEIDSVAAELPIYTPTDLDYEGPHDEVLPEVEEEEDNVFKMPLPVEVWAQKKFGRQQQQQKRSVSPPKNMAPEEKTVPRKRSTTNAAHEAWIDSLGKAPEEVLTEHEKEIAEMRLRRAKFWKQMRDAYLE